MKAMVTTLFGVSAACCRATRPHAPLLCHCYKNLYQAKCSFLKSMNSPKGLSINFNSVEPKLLKFSTDATQNGKLETTGVPNSVPVHVAHELLVAGHRYLDVRTPEEFNAGHAPGAVNIPYMYKIGSGMTKNADFLAEVTAHFSKVDQIIVILIFWFHRGELGKRSMMAATDLVAAEFTGVTDIAGGYATWTQNGLPTEL